MIKSLKTQVARQKGPERRLQIFICKIELFICKVLSGSEVRGRGRGHSSVVALQQMEADEECIDFHTDILYKYWDFSNIFQYFLPLSSQSGQKCLFRN